MALELEEFLFAEDLIATWETCDVEALGGPQRALIESWGFLEICCGPNAPLTTACLAAGLRCGPRVGMMLHGV